MPNRSKLFARYNESLQRLTDEQNTAFYFNKVRSRSNDRGFVSVHTSNEKNHRDMGFNVFPTR